MPITSRRIDPCGTNCADVGADALLLVGRALRGEIDRAAAVGIDEHRGQSLRQQRLAVLQLLGGEPAAGVRVHVDEARRDVAIAGIDHGLRRGVAERSHGANAIAGDADVGAIPGIAGAVEHAAVADQDVELLRRLRGRRNRDARAQRACAGVRNEPECTELRIARMSTYS